MKEKYDLDIYLEPGEAIALNAGYLVTTVTGYGGKRDIQTLDTWTHPQHAICRMCWKCHIVRHLKTARECRRKRSILTGYLPIPALQAILSGIILLTKRIKVDDRLYFEDMAIYSMVKNNTFNGIPLPDIAVMDESGECKVIRSFSYEDFKGRLS